MGPEASTGSPPLPSGLRFFVAPNPGPFTLDGTRTYVVGARRPAIIDPGPDLGEHLTRLEEAVADADRVVILLTHGHPDHAGGAQRLAERLRERAGSRRRSPYDEGAAAPAGEALAGAAPRIVEILGSGPGVRPFAPGDAVETDAGPLEPVPTPGHTRDHLAFLWGDAAFVGDLVLGEGETTWLGEYSGCVADYLDSLDRLEARGCTVLFPAHGPPIHEVEGRIERFRRHRLTRVEEVRAALAEQPGLDLDGLTAQVYGAALPPELRAAARRSVEVMVAHLDASRHG